MASIRKIKNGYRAEVYVSGVRRSKFCDTRAQAKDWAAETELALKTKPADNGSKMTMADLWDEWVRRYAATRQYGDWETKRLEFFKHFRLAKVKLSEVSTIHAADFRDQRLKETLPGIQPAPVSEGTLLRDWNVLSVVCTTAVQEMKWLTSNPFKGVKRPPSPPPRTRIPTDYELECIQAFATEKLWRIAEFAIETGMRQGEIAGLTHDKVTGNVARLPKTKNGKPRDVPLSERAAALIGQADKPESLVFGVSAGYIDAMWRKACQKANVEDLHFHDLRGLAATRLSKKLNPLQLCKMFGWSDMKFAMVYYRETAEDIAKLL